jgi:hypothetical protein
MADMELQPTRNLITIRNVKYPYLNLRSMISNCTQALTISGIPEPWNEIEARFTAPGVFKLVDMTAGQFLPLLGEVTLDQKHTFLLHMFGLVSHLLSFYYIYI